MKKINGIRKEWKTVYHFMRLIASEYDNFNWWYNSERTLAMLSAVRIGVDIQKMDDLPSVHSWNKSNGYEVIFRGRHFTIDYADALTINIKEGSDNNRNRWQEFTQQLEKKAEIERKRECLFNIVATSSDWAIDHIYRSAVVWSRWGK